MKINIIRKVIDIIMVILFIIMMGYHITGDKVHEILGVVTFITFVIHNILNIKWYKNIFKGKYNFRRVLSLIINILLLIAMLGMMISGIIISSNVFAFLNIQTTMFGRSLHMVSTSWGFVLMAIHVGLHLNIILFKINNKMKNSTFEYIYYLIILILMSYGLYTFIDSGVWKDMLLITKFKFFDYDQNPFIFYLGQFCILTLFSLIIQIILKFINKTKKTDKF